MPLRLIASNANAEWSFADPYSFGPVLGPMDDYYSAEGTHLRLFDKLGAHVIEHEGAKGVQFAVWGAERRARVDRRRLQRLGRPAACDAAPPLGRGLGDLHPRPRCGDDLQVRDRGGPTSGWCRSRPTRWRSPRRSGRGRPPSLRHPRHSCGRMPRISHRVVGRDPRRTPMSIYEVHLGSWRRGADGGFLSYDVLAAELIPYAVGLGFTHIELLPITEHRPRRFMGIPADGAVRTDLALRRAGRVRALRRCGACGRPRRHPRLGAGAFSYRSARAGALRRHPRSIEHADPRKGFHPDWNTAIYNFGRKEVSAFLVNSALYWLERFHLDGLRVDAVASMLYLDYSRAAGT